jgi:O-antigen ligase
MQKTVPNINLSPSKHKFYYWVNKSGDKLSIYSLIFIILLLPFDKIYIEIFRIHLNLPDIIIVLYTILLTLRTLLIKNYSLFRPNSKVLYLGIVVLLFSITMSSHLTGWNYSSLIYIFSILAKLVLLFISFSVFRLGYHSIIVISFTYIIGANIVSVYAIIQYIQHLIHSSWSQISISGTFNNRNSMLFYLVPGVLMLFPYIFSSADKRYQKLVFIKISAIIIPLTILFSRGRVGLVSLLLPSLPILYFYGKLKKSLVYIVAIISIPIVLIGKYYPPIAEELISRYQSIININATINSEIIQNTRILLYDTALEFVRNNIWFGIGPGQFRGHSIIVNNIQLNAHNTFLGVLTELGIIGLFGFLLILLAGYINVRSHYRYFNNEKILIVLLAIYSSCLFQSFFYDAIGLYQIWIFLGACLGVSKKSVTYKY